MIGLQTKLLIVLALVVVGLIAVMRIAHYWHPAKEPRVWIREYTVSQVVSGTFMRVTGGILGRRQKDLILAGVIAPADETLNAAATENLKKLAGTKVRVEQTGRILFSGDGKETEIEPLEASVISGKVFGESGCCLQVEQLRAGYVETIGKVPAEYVAAQKQAKKSGLGMWSK